MARRAVVFYDVQAPDREKAKAIYGGLRECVDELLELGEDDDSIVRALEQLCNDVETGML